MNNQRKTAVVIICCYGIFYQDHETNPRSPIELVGYKRYIEGVAFKIRSLNIIHDITEVWLCGGFTDTNSMISEAASVKPELVRHFHLIPDITQRIRLDEKSVNSVQNINNPINAMTSPPNKIIVFSDKCREIKSKAIIHRVKRKFRSLPDDQRPQFGTIGIPRLDNHPNSRWWKQALKAGEYLVSDQAYLRDLNQPAPQTN